MIKIGVTGSIASGKSTFAKLLSQRKHPIFNADKEVNDLYKKNFFKNKIKNIFNLKDKKNIKKKVKEVIKKNNKNIKKLEATIHPLVRKRMKVFMFSKKKKKILIFEIPLLIESKLMKHFDVIVFVTSSKKIRLNRYLSNGGNKKIFTLLNKRQIKPRKKMKISDHTIFNNSSLKVLKRKAKMMIKNYE
tara:strand:+ start:2349 stop:2915 length:567 start_codon:yes stop_codon:yes gene_type:complete